MFALAGSKNYDAEIIQTQTKNREDMLKFFWNLQKLQLSLIFFSEKSSKSIHLRLFTAPPSPCFVPKAMYSMSVEERMGPGGLDPVEVFESLPAELQECILAAIFFCCLPWKKDNGLNIEMGTIIFCFGGGCIKLQTYNAKLMVI